jgi:hypothetical protein
MDEAGLLIAVLGQGRAEREREHKEDRDDDKRAKDSSESSLHRQKACPNPT